MPKSLFDKCRALLLEELLPQSLDVEESRVVLSNFIGVARDVSAEIVKEYQGELQALDWVSFRDAADTAQDVFLAESAEEEEGDDEGDDEGDEE